MKGAMLAPKIYSFCNLSLMSFPVAATFNGELIPSILLRLLSRDKPDEMQSAAAKCLTYMCRAGAIDPSDTVISHKVEPL